MQVTLHMHRRMDQCAISSELVALAVDIGGIEGDRYVLTRETIDTEAVALRQRLKTLGGARDKVALQLWLNLTDLRRVHRKHLDL